MAQITNHRHSFEKDFRHNDGRAHIQVNSTAIELSSHTAKQAEVVIRHLAQGFAGRLRMCVDNIRTNRHMNGNGQFTSVCSGENAHWKVLKSDSLRVPIRNEPSQTLAKSDAVV